MPPYTSLFILPFTLTHYTPAFIPTQNNGPDYTQNMDYSKKVLTDPNTALNNLKVKIKSTMAQHKEILHTAILNICFSNNGDKKITKY